MAERNLDAIVIEGPSGLTGANAAWNYIVGGETEVLSTLVDRGDALEPGAVVTIKPGL